MTYAGYIEAQCTVPSSTTISVTTPAGGPTTVTLTAGSYYMLELASHLQSVLNAQRPGSVATWTVTISTTGTSPTGLTTIALTTGATESYSITWTSTDLRDMLGFASNISSQSTATGTLACRGVFIPDRPLNLDDDPRAAPMLTDLRETESPTGYGLAVVGNVKYVHTGLRYAHVTRERYMDTDSGVTPSWARFVKNTQLGQGHSWFTPRSRVKITDHTAVLVGSVDGVTKWWMRGINRVSARKMNEAWTGAWMIEIPALVSDGS